MPKSQRRHQDRPHRVEVITHRTFEPQPVGQHAFPQLGPLAKFALEREGDEVSAISDVSNRRDGGIMPAGEVVDGPVATAHQVFRGGHEEPGNDFA